MISSFQKASCQPAQSNLAQYWIKIMFIKASEWIARNKQMTPPTFHFQNKLLESLANLPLCYSQEALFSGCTAISREPRSVNLQIIPRRWEINEALELLSKNKSLVVLKERNPRLYGNNRGLPLEHRSKDGEGWHHHGSSSDLRIWLSGGRWLISVSPAADWQTGFQRWASTRELLWGEKSAWKRRLFLKVTPWLGERKMWNGSAGNVKTNL